MIELAKEAGAYDAVECTHWADGGDLLLNISNTRKRVSSDIQTLRSRLKKRGAAEFFKQLRGVWISDETHFLVFDMAS